MRLDVAISIALLPIAIASSSASPKFDLQLGAPYPGEGPFGASPSQKHWLLRAYQNEPVELIVTGYVSGAEPPPVTNDQLTSELQLCVLSGAEHPEILAGEPLNCLPGVSWSRSAVDAPGWQIQALLSTTAALPPGEYTVVAMLPNAGLQQLLGNSANQQLRSNPIVVKAGPSTTQNEELSRLLRVAERANATEDWDGAIAASQTLLTSYPTSVFALMNLGYAQAGKGQVEAALASYNSAQEILSQATDTLCPDVLTTRKLIELRGEIGRAVNDLLYPPPEE